MRFLWGNIRVFQLFYLSSSLRHSNETIHTNFSDVNYDDRANFLSILDSLSSYYIDLAFSDPKRWICNCNLKPSQCMVKCIVMCILYSMNGLMDRNNKYIQCIRDLSCFSYLLHFRVTHGLWINRGLLQVVVIRQNFP